MTPFRGGYKCVWGHAHMCMSTCNFSIYSLNAGPLVYIACYTVPRHIPKSPRPYPPMYFAFNAKVMSAMGYRYSEFPSSFHWKQGLFLQASQHSTLMPGMWNYLTQLPSPSGNPKAQVYSSIIYLKRGYQILFAKVSVPQYCPRLWTSIT